MQINTHAVVQSPLTMKRAIEAVTVAERTAVRGSNETATVTEGELQQGVAAARQAVLLLGTARPASAYQHLDVAASGMQAAADALASATTVVHSAGADYSTNAQAVADVQRFAKVAFEAIDGAWESITND